MKSSLARLLTVTLTFLYFLTNCALGHAVETNFWSDRRKALTGTSENLDSPQRVAALPAPFPTIPTFPSTLTQPLRNEIPQGLDRRYGPLIKALSAQFGTVRKISIPPVDNTLSANPPKTVIHIQDIHLNAEAQSQIDRTVQDLIQQKKIDLIALEGAFAPVDLASLRAFKDQKAVRLVADYLLKTNRVSGAVHAAFVSPADIPPVAGVDEPVHYRANVDAYLSSLPKINSAKTYVARQKEFINRRRQVFFNKKLADFDDHVQAYRAGKISLGEHVKFLERNSPLRSAAVETFLESYKLETGLDFAQVERERTVVLAQLLKKLDTTQTRDLLNASLAYRLGNLRGADFYQYLKETCAKNGIRLASFRAMDSYIQYVLLSDAIDSEKLFAEIEDMEKAGYEALATNEPEKLLIRESKRLYLIGKLIDFSLTPEEWRTYKELKNEIPTQFISSSPREEGSSLHANPNLTMAPLIQHSPSPREGRGQERGITEALVKYFTVDRSETGVSFSRRSGLAPSPVPSPPSSGRGTNLGSGSVVNFPLVSHGQPPRGQRNTHSAWGVSIDLKSFEDFYREAEIRNHALANNLLREMDERHASVAVLVTGGFHTDGVDRLLKNAGVASITFAPKITKIEADNGSTYLSVFAQEKTPLDKLFAGEKLFVPPPPGQLTLAPPLEEATFLAEHNRQGWARVSIPEGNLEEQLTPDRSSIAGVSFHKNFRTWAGEIRYGVRSVRLLLLHACQAVFPALAAWPVRLAIFALISLSVLGQPINSNQIISTSIRNQRTYLTSAKLDPSNPPQIQSALKKLDSDFPDVDLLIFDGVQTNYPLAVHRIIDQMDKGLSMAHDFNPALYKKFPGYARWWNRFIEILPKKFGKFRFTRFSSSLWRDTHVIRMNGQDIMLFFKEFNSPPYLLDPEIIVTTNNIDSLWQHVFARIFCHPAFLPKNYREKWGSLTRDLKDDPVELYVNHMRRSLGLETDPFTVHPELLKFTDDIAQARVQIPSNWTARPEVWVVIVGFLILFLLALGQFTNIFRINKVSVWAPRIVLIVPNSQREYVRMLVQRINAYSLWPDSDIKIIYSDQDKSHPDLVKEITDFNPHIVLEYQPADANDGVYLQPNELPLDPATFLVATVDNIHPTNSKKPASSHHPRLSRSENRSDIVISHSRKTDPDNLEFDAQYLWDELQTGAKKKSFLMSRFKDTSLKKPRQGDSMPMTDDPETQLPALESLRSEFEPFVLSHDDIGKIKNLFDTPPDGDFYTLEQRFLRELKWRIWNEADDPEDPHTLEANNYKSALVGSLASLWIVAGRDAKVKEQILANFDQSLAGKNGLKILIVDGFDLAGAQSAWYVPTADHPQSTIVISRDYLRGLINSNKKLIEFYQHTNKFDGFVLPGEFEKHRLGEFLDTVMHSLLAERLWIHEHTHRPISITDSTESNRDAQLNEEKRVMEFEQSYQAAILRIFGTQTDPEGKVEKPIGTVEFLLALLKNSDDSESTYDVIAAPERFRVLRGTRLREGFETIAQFIEKIYLHLHPLRFAMSDNIEKNPPPPNKLGQEAFEPKPGAKTANDIELEKFLPLMAELQNMTRQQRLDVSIQVSRIGGSWSVGLSEYHRGKKIDFLNYIEELNDKPEIPGQKSESGSTLKEVLMATVGAGLVSSLAALAIGLAFHIFTTERALGNPTPLTGTNLLRQLKEFNPAPTGMMTFTNFSFTPTDKPGLHTDDSFGLAKEVLKRQPDLAGRLAQLSSPDQKIRRAAAQWFDRPEAQIDIEALRYSLKPIGHIAELALRDSDIQPQLVALLRRIVLFDGKEYRVELGAPFSPRHCATYYGPALREMEPYVDGFQKLFIRTDHPKIIYDWGLIFIGIHINNTPSDYLLMEDVLRKFQNLEKEPANKWRRNVWMGLRDLLRRVNDIKQIGIAPLATGPQMEVTAYSLSKQTQALNADILRQAEYSIAQRNLAFKFRIIVTSLFYTGLFIGGLSLVYRFGRFVKKRWLTLFLSAGLLLSQLPATSQNTSPVKTNPPVKVESGIEWENSPLNQLQSLSWAPVRPAGPIETKTNEFGLSERTLQRAPNLPGILAQLTSTNPHARRQAVLFLLDDTRTAEDDLNYLRESPAALALIVRKAFTNPDADPPLINLLSRLALSEQMGRTIFFKSVLDVIQNEFLDSFQLALQNTSDASVLLNVGKLLQGIQIQDENFHIKVRARILGKALSLYRTELTAANRPLRDSLIELADWIKDLKIIWLARFEESTDGTGNYAVKVDQFPLTDQFITMHQNTARSVRSLLYQPLRFGEIEAYFSMCILFLASCYLVIFKSAQYKKSLQGETPGTLDLLDLDPRPIKVTVVSLYLKNVWPILQFEKKFFTVPLVETLFAFFQASVLYFFTVNLFEMNPAPAVILTALAVTTMTSFMISIIRRLPIHAGTSGIFNSVIVSNRKSGLLRIGVYLPLYLYFWLSSLYPHLGWALFFLGYFSSVLLTYLNYILSMGKIRRASLLGLEAGQVRTISSKLNWLTLILTAMVALVLLWMPGNPRLNTFRQFFSTSLFLAINLIIGAGVFGAIWFFKYYLPKRRLSKPIDSSLGKMGPITPIENRILVSFAEERILNTKRRILSKLPFLLIDAKNIRMDKFDLASLALKCARALTLTEGKVVSWSDPEQSAALEQEFNILATSPDSFLVVQLNCPISKKFENILWLDENTRGRLILITDKPEYLIFCKQRIGLENLLPLHVTTRSSFVVIRDLSPHLRKRETGSVLMEWLWIPAVVVLALVSLLAPRGLGQNLDPNRILTVGERTAKNAAVLKVDTNRPVFRPSAPSRDKPAPANPELQSELKLSVKNLRARFPYIDISLVNGVERHAPGSAIKIIEQIKKGLLRAHDFNTLYYPIKMPPVCRRWNNIIERLPALLRFLRVTRYDPPQAQTYVILWSGDHLDLTSPNSPLSPDLFPSRVPVTSDNIESLWKRIFAGTFTEWFMLPPATASRWKTLTAGKEEGPIALYHDHLRLSMGISIDHQFRIYPELKKFTDRLAQGTIVNEANKKIWIVPLALAAVGATILFRKRIWKMISAWFLLIVILNVSNVARAQDAAKLEGEKRGFSGYSPARIDNTMAHVNYFGDWVSEPAAVGSGNSDDKLQAIGRAIATAISHFMDGILTSRDMDALIEIGKTGVEGGRGLRGLSPDDRKIVIEQAGRILRSLRSGKTSVRPISAGESLLTAFQVAETAAPIPVIENPRRNYLWALPRVNDATNSQALATVRRLLTNLPEGRKIVLVIHKDDRDAWTELFSILDHQKNQVVLLATGETFTDESGYRLKDLIRHVAAKQIQYLDNSIFVIPDENVDFDNFRNEIDPGLWDQIQVARLSTLLSPAPAAVGLDLLIPIYELIRTYA